LWYENGQKKYEGTFKDGKQVSETKWDKEGNEIK
jgi:antitoxin component YwqK of YwqJK toxin-antitoxin module